MSKQAIRPNFIDSIPTLKEKVSDPKVSDDDQALWSMSNHSGWKVWTDFVDSLVKDLDNMTQVSMGNGASFEEIGRNAVVIALAKGLIERAFNKVADARESVEKTNA